MKKALAAVCLLILCLALSVSFAAAAVPGIAFADSGDSDTDYSDTDRTIDEQSQRYIDEASRSNAERASNPYSSGDRESGPDLAPILVFGGLGLVALFILYRTVIRKYIRKKKEEALEKRLVQINERLEQESGGSPARK